MRISGKACYIGINGTMVTTELSAAKTIISNFNFSRSTPKVEVTDGNNNILTKAYANPQDKVEVEAIVTSAASPGTISDVQANILMPLAGSTVTLGETGVPMMDGDWTFDGEGGPVPSKSDALKLRLTLIRTGPPTNNVPTALTPVN